MTYSLLPSILLLRLRCAGKQHLVTSGRTQIRNVKVTAEVGANPEAATYIVLI